MLDRLDIDCEGIKDDNATRQFYEHWIYDTNIVEKAIRLSNNRSESRRAYHLFIHFMNEGSLIPFLTLRCATIRELFDFRSAPLSREEEEFPLAYGLVVYKNLAQVQSP